MKRSKQRNDTIEISSSVYCQGPKASGWSITALKDHVNSLVVYLETSEPNKVLISMFTKNVKYFEIVLSIKNARKLVREINKRLKTVVKPI